jgi:hypothetical protein
MKAESASFGIFFHFCPPEILNFDFQRRSCTETVNLEFVLQRENDEKLQV